MVLGAKEKDKISFLDRITTKNKCRYVMVALQEALEMGHVVTDKRKRWQADCCRTACETLAQVGITDSLHPLIVARSHMVFRDLGNMFPHPNPRRAAGEKPEPPFFVEFPAAKLSLTRHADELLKSRDLSIRNLYDYVNYTSLPRLIQEYNDVVGPAKHITQLQFLKNLGSMKRMKIKQDESDDESRR